ncbi:hypothetical protein BDV93DRAFT_601037 [Ceratobasidium sp. AG-I]|nr:hypothetical protein BDV93DRAFT_601037 [Ceratobasidium sp. AG-I]
MKRKRGAPKALADVANAVFLVPDAEAEKQEQEPEDPRVAEWNAFAQDHYELVEQLPLSLHRSFSLLRELDDLAQVNTARILPATRAYIALRESLLPKAPSGLDLLAHVSASVEPPAAVPALPEPKQSPGPAPAIPMPNLAPTPPPAAAVNLLPTAGPASFVQPHSEDPASAGSGAAIPADLNGPDLAQSLKPVETEPQSAPCPPFPNESRALLTLIATLASDASRASQEKLGIANAVYQTIDNHVRTLDTLIAQHKSTLPPTPQPTPPPAPPLVSSPSPQPAAFSPSHSTKPRTRRRTQGEGEDAGAEDDAGAGAGEIQTIPPLRLTRTGATPTTIRLRGKSTSKPKPDALDVEMTGDPQSSPSRKPKSTPISKGPSNSSSTKGALGGGGRHTSSGSASGGNTKTGRSGKPPRGRKQTQANGSGDAGEVDPNERLYCYCGQVSFGEMIGCDGDDCALEWFHLPCVGLDIVPKDKWYCKECDQVRKKRRRRA